MNCGLEALQKIVDLKGMSAFTLIHLGKDNGVDLKLFKVKEADLPLVHRPAIFHADNHFEFIKNGEALPKLDWTGYILTEKSIGRPISHKEAKLVKGEWAAVVIPVVKFVASVVAPKVIAGAAVGAVGGAATAAITGQDIGKGAASGAKFGGITGGVLGAVGGLAGAAAGPGVTLASKAGNLLKSGASAATGAVNALGGAVGLSPALAQGTVAGAGVGATTGQTRGIPGALMGAVGGAGIGAGISGIDKFVTGFKGAGSLGQKLSGGFKSLAGVPQAPTGAPGIPSQIATGATPPGALTATFPGIGQGPIPVGATGAGIIGTGASQFSSTGINFNPDLVARLGQNFSKAPGAINAATLAGGAQQVIGAQQQAGQLSQLAKGLGAAGVASAAQSAGPQTKATIDFDPTKEFTAIRDFLGDARLPAATEKELINLVDTPIQDLTTEFSFQNDRVFRRINESFDKQSAVLQRQFAQSGQNVRTSSELRNEMSRLEKDRATILGEAEQELAAENLSRGIQAKQFALSASLEKGQYDSRVALELADVIGTKAALEAAIQNDDVDTFRELMAQVLQIGFGSGSSTA